MSASAHDFFDPAIEQARFVGRQVATLKEADVLGNGGKRIGGWRMELDGEAQLKNLERMVRDESLGKVFGDGKVMDAISEFKVVEVSFYEMRDGTGMQIAKIQGGEGSIAALLSAADMSDLDLAPKYRAPKQESAGPKMATLAIEGQQLQVSISEPVVEPIRRAPIDPRRAGGAVPVNMRNPLAAKAFLAQALTANSMAMPSFELGDMPYAAIVTLSPEAHPEDKAWPKGIKVSDLDTGEQIKGPVQALAQFARAAAGLEGPIVERDDLVEQFNARRAKM